jgi:hypothetical protein
MGEDIGIESFHPGERGPGAAALTIPSQGEARDRALRAHAVDGASERAAADCPGCRSAGSVSGGFCQVCYADQAASELPLDDHGTSPAADLPPTAGGPLASLAPVAPVAPVAPLRFADVIEELRAAALLATGPVPPESVTAACRRLEELLEHLRMQFLADMGLSEPDLAEPVPAG